MEAKIIFTGPVGAGKTTAIRTISDIAVVGTEAAASDEVAARKPATTVAMDYGVLNLDSGTKVHLYGTPGQSRFSFMWEILSEGAMGFVLLLDSLRDDPLADLETYLNAFGKSIADSGHAVVVGLSHIEESSRPALRAQLQERLDVLKLTIPVFEVDSRCRGDVKQLLLALFALINPAIGRSAEVA